MISIIGDIDFESYAEFHKKLSKLEKMPAKYPSGPVQVYLTSEGGLAPISLAFFDRIRLSPLDIHITAIGYCCSAAILVLAAGDYRRMTRNTSAMVHDETPSPDDVKSIRLSQLEKSVKDYRFAEDQQNQLLADCTKTSIDKWKELHENETWLTAQQCLELGLIEEVI